MRREFLKRLRAFHIEGGAGRDNVDLSAFAARGPAADFDAAGINALLRRQVSLGVHCTLLRQADATNGLDAETSSGVAYSWNKDTPVKDDQGNWTCKLKDVKVHSYMDKTQSGVKPDAKILRSWGCLFETNSHGPDRPSGASVNSTRRPYAFSGSACR